SALDASREMAAPHQHSNCPAFHPCVCLRSNSETHQFRNHRLRWNVPTYFLTSLLRGEAELQMGGNLTRQARPAELSEISVQVKARLRRRLQIAPQIRKGLEDRPFISDLGKEGSLRRVLAQQPRIPAARRLVETQDRATGLHVFEELRVVPPNPN